MKKTVLGVAAMAALVFAACKKDDKKSNEDLILGKWYQVSVVEKETNVKTGKDTTYTSALPDSYMDFRSDGHVYSYDSRPGDESYVTAQYKISGNRLIVNYDINDADTVTIKTLTGNTLQVSETYSSDNYSVEGVSTYKK